MWTFTAPLARAALRTSRSGASSSTSTGVSSRSTGFSPRSEIVSSRSTNLSAGPEVISPTTISYSILARSCKPASSSLANTVELLNSTPANEFGGISSISTIASSRLMPVQATSGSIPAVTLTSRSLLSLRQKSSVRVFSTQADNGGAMTHLDERGRARMVDVGEKAVTSRIAEAECSLRVGARLLRLLRDARLPKGDALTVAQIAGIVGAKKTSDLIPMCHPLPLDCVRVKIELPKGECEDGGDITIHCEVRVTSRTGVEMEALTGAAVAALALYDMCKSVDKHMKVMNLRVVKKAGGRSGDWPRQPPPELKVRAHNTTPIKPDETFAPTNIMHF